MNRKMLAIEAGKSYAILYTYAAENVCSFNCNFVIIYFALVLRITFIAYYVGNYGMHFNY